MFLLAIAVSFCFSLEVHAAATPSEASPSEALTEPDLEEIEEMTDMEFKDLFFEWMNSIVGGPQNATASEADMEDPEIDPNDPIPGEVYPFNAPLLLAATGEDHFVNVVRFDVSVSGTDYTLLFSPSYLDQLYVDAQNRLWNMGTGSIQGLVLEGGFNPYRTEGTLVYLAPCLGNNFSVNQNYGSPNYFREYYWNSSGRLTYNDRYVQIEVEKSYFTFLVGDTLTYIIIFLVGGGVLLCWLNRFKRY